MSPKGKSKAELEGELKELRAELARAKGEYDHLRQQIDMVVNSLGEGIYSIDLNGDFTFVNQVAARLLGYEQKELVGRPHELILKEPPEASAAEAPTGGSADSAQGGEVIVHNLNSDTFWKRDGTSFPVEYVRTPVLEKGELVGTVVTFRDVTERKKLEQNLQTLAVTDGLTGLHNRMYFTNKLDEEFQRASRYEAPLSLILMDIDYFKSVNDTYGHQAGDAYLKAISALIRSSIRRVDVAARYGGEELVVILPHTEARAAALLAERLRERVAAMEVHFGGHAIRRTISVGVATCTPGSVKTMDEFLTAVDNALYAAKRAGRDRVVAHTEAGGPDSR